MTTKLQDSNSFLEENAGELGLTSQSPNFPLVLVKSGYHLSCFQRPQLQKAVAASTDDLETVVEETGSYNRRLMAFESLK